MARVILADVIQKTLKITLMRLDETWEKLLISVLI